MATAEFTQANFDSVTSGGGAGAGGLLGRVVRLSPDFEVLRWFPLPPACLPAHSAETAVQH